MIQLLTDTNQPATLSLGWGGVKWGAIFALAFAVGGNQTCLLFAVVALLPGCLSLFLLIWQMLISRAKRMEGYERIN